MSRAPSFLAVALATLLFAGPVQAADNADGGVEPFHPPVRLLADGQPIDTGEAWGHSGPHLADVDGDGLTDLVVGDFSGKFRFFRNRGSNEKPDYTAAGYLMAGDEAAKVQIYCCIGSSPLLVDWDDDGTLDLLSGSYDPGECYLFRGAGGGKFHPRETLVDQHNKPVLHRPGQPDYASFGSWPAVVDWDADGDLDLLVGTFEGTMFVRLNEGTRARPLLAAENLVVEVDGHELKLESQHATPVVVDWDGDGLWDLLSGSDGGTVYWLRNTGRLGAPRFDAPRVLVAGPQGKQLYDSVIEAGAAPPVGSRTQIAAADYNHDGKVDLLVGDFGTSVTLRPDLASAERTEFDSVRQRFREAAAGIRAAVEGLRSDFRSRYPGDEVFTPAVEAEWTAAYKALCDSEAFQQNQRTLKETMAASERFLLKPATKGRFEEYSTTHGHVWLFLRK